VTIRFVHGGVDEDLDATRGCTPGCAASSFARLAAASSRRAARAADACAGLTQRDEPRQRRIVRRRVGDGQRV